MTITPEELAKRLHRALTTDETRQAVATLDERGGEFIDAFMEQARSIVPDVFVAPSEKDNAN